MQYVFPYDTIAPVEIPDSHPVDIYSVKAIDGVAETPEAIVVASLAAPIGMPRLSQIVHADSRILIIIDDMSRPTPAHQIVPALLRELARGGARESNIRFLVALGTHRPMTTPEIVAKIGVAAATRFPVSNHEWDDPAARHDYGALDDGTRVVLNRAMHESDLVIGVGSIAPHPAAGFSGGSKIIAPGVATAAAVGEFHWRSVHYAQKDVLGVRDNPMRERIDCMARLAGLTAIVNVVLDGACKIVRCFTGDPVAAHRAGCDWAGPLYRVNIDRAETADIFIIDTHPLDQDLWQGVKAMCALECLVPDDAVVIVVTPCPEGVSRQHPDVLALGYRGLAAATELVRAGRLDRVTAHNIVQGGKLIERTQAFLVSPGIAADDIKRLGFLPFSSVQDALNEATQRKGPTARVIILGTGGEICPVAR
ncbi:nickel-dependent lactate racemase [candidate division KSB1 bacterium]|nr:nickel-dependent lactate racemase [candidate division KSB1 bacterium]